MRQSLAGSLGATSYPLGLRGNEHDFDPCAREVAADGTVTMKSIGGKKMHTAHKVAWCAKTKAPRDYSKPSRTGGKPYVPIKASG